MATPSPKDMMSLLRSEGVKAVVFDFDCTITLKHSGGRVRHDRMETYLKDNISPCFMQLLPALLKEKFFVGVATFADSYKCPPSHVAGEDLVRYLFKHYMGHDYATEVAVVAAYPENYQSETAYKSIGLSAPMPLSKEFHLGKLCQQWQLTAQEVALVDDDLHNVEAAYKDGHPIRFVQLRKGLTAEDMMASAGTKR